MTSTGNYVEVPLVDKHDDQVDSHNYSWVVAYLQEDSMYTVVGLHKDAQQQSTGLTKEQFFFFANSYSERRGNRFVLLFLSLNN